MSEFVWSARSTSYNKVVFRSLNTEKHPSSSFKLVDSEMKAVGLEGFLAGQPFILVLKNSAR